MEIYHTIYKGGNGEIVEKKSRFIAEVHPVTSEEEAMEILEQTRKQYWDARHHCWAYIIGRNPAAERMSDDGEPAGTAGRPMLDVLLKEGIHNTAVVVTRYFGGVLLGTGGLVRAYQGAVQKGLDAAVIIEKFEGQILLITTDYTGLGKIQYLLAQEKITIMDTSYADNVVIKAVIPEECRKDIENKIIEHTNAAALIEWKEKVTFAQHEKEVLIWENNL